MSKNLKYVLFGLALVVVAVLVIQSNKSSSARSADIEGVKECLTSCEGIIDGLAEIDKNSPNYATQVARLEAKLKTKYDQCSYMNSLLASGEKSEEPIELRFSDDDIREKCAQPITTACTKQICTAGVCTTIANNDGSSCSTASIQNGTCQGGVCSETVAREPDCTENAECTSDKVCKSGSCFSQVCTNSSDCPTDYSCLTGNKGIGKCVRT